VEGYLPDMLPVIGWSRTTPGLLHAFGFSGHGFQLAPGVGAVVADLIVDGKSQTPIESFSIGRFAGDVMPDEKLWREFDPDIVSAFRETRQEVDHA
jgi:sarcosine oxidase, subunit beta